MTSTHQKNLFLVDRDPQDRDRLTSYLRAQGHTVRELADITDLPPTADGALAILIDHEDAVEAGFDYASPFPREPRASHAVMITNDWRANAADGKGGHSAQTLLLVRSQPLAADELNRLVDSWEVRWSSSDHWRKDG